MRLKDFGSLWHQILQSVPKGDWFCPTCKPKEKKAPAKKTRKVFDDDDENMDSILEEDER